MEPLVLPPHNQYSESLVDLAEAYISHINDDAGKFPLEQRVDGGLYGASREVGELCKEFKLGSAFNGAIADHAARIRTTLAEEVSRFVTRSKRHKFDLLSVSVGLIESSHDPDAVAEIQHEEHKIVIRTLGVLLPALQLNARRTFEQPYGRTVGEVAELTALGLLTRQAPGRLLATMSLPHQNFRTNNNKADNFDISLIANQLKFHKIQVKAGCFGECLNQTEADYTDPAADKVLRRRAKRINLEYLQHNLRQAYSPDICLASGCCDLGMTKNGAERDSPLGHLLVAEANGSITPEGLQTLDTASQKLIETIANNAGRRGTHQENDEKLPIAN
jgi:hypothetical protein